MMENSMRNPTSLAKKAVAVLAAVVVAAGGLLLPAPADAAAGAAEFTPPSPAGLPAPYANWHVTLRPEATNPQVLTLEFDSPTAGVRMVNTVFVPDSYRSTGAPSPVLYSLHGTIFPELDNHLLDPVTSHEELLAMTGPGGGDKQTQRYRADTQLAAAKFLFVAPDTTQGQPWCETCTWIDGRADLLPNVPSVTARPRQADTFLHKELFPLVEHLFNVRTDRGGRGVIGFSMGGWSALLQGFKHPDDYGFVASVSGLYDPLSDAAISALIDVVGYLRDQGYGTELTDNTWWRNFSPADTITNAVGTGQTLLMTSGDACLPLASLAAPDCRAYPPLLNPAATTIELLIDGQFQRAKQGAQAAGMPVTFVQKPGVHGANNHDVYAHDIVPAANAAFGRTLPAPATFTYRAVEKNFSVWGYDIAVTRPTDEFLELNGRTDGRELSVTGSGTVTVTTPGTFPAGTAHQVTVQVGSGNPQTAISTADTSGHVSARLTLPDGQLTTATLTIR